MEGKKQTIAEGALVLTLAIAFVKLVGAIYKFPLISRLAGGGWGYYTSAYNIYVVIYAIAVTGFPSAVSRLVAGAYAEGRYRDCVKIKEQAVKLFLCIGIAGCLILTFSAKWLAVTVMENPNVYYSVLAVAPSLIFSSVMAAYGGYYQGLTNMIPSSWCEVVEILVKAVCSYGGVVIVNRILYYEYQTKGTILGVVQSESTMSSAMLSVTAATAIFGVTLSTMAGWLYFRSVYKRMGSCIPEAMLQASQPPMSDRLIIKQLLRLAIPITLSAASLRVTSLIDNATVIRCLNDVVQTDIRALYLSHQGLLSQVEVEVADIPNYLYEVYGYGIIFFDLVPTITAAFGTSAMPHITASFAANRHDQAKKNIEITLNITMLIAAPMGFGLCFMAEPVLRLVYSDLPIGAQLAAPMLRVLGIAAIFSSLTSSINTMFQSIGKIYTPVIIMVGGSILKILANSTLVSIPKLNIKAAATGNLICFTATSVAGIILLLKYTGIRINFWSTMVKPILGGAFACGCARLIYNLIQPVLGIRISALIGICIAVIIYMAVVLLLNFMSKEEMESIPGLNKLVPYLVSKGFLK